MTRKRTVRRVWTLLNPIAHAIKGATKTSESDLDQLRMRELSAIDAFAKGHATLKHWHDLSAMLNLAESMGKAGIGPEVLPVCAAAQGELIESAKRFERIQKFGMSGPGLTAIRDLYEFHDLQRQSVDRSTYERHVNKAVNRIRSKAPEVVVLK